MRRPPGAGSRYAGNSRDLGRARAEGDLDPYRGADRVECEGVAGEVGVGSLTAFVAVVPAESRNRLSFASPRRMSSPPLPDMPSIEAKVSPSASPERAAGQKVGHHARRRRGVADLVVAEPPSERVGTRPATERVVSVAADKPVDPRATDEAVGAVATEEPVVAFEAPPAYRTRRVRRGSLRAWSP